MTKNATPIKIALPSTIPILLDLLLLRTAKRRAVLKVLIVVHTTMICGCGGWSCIAVWLLLWWWWLVKVGRRIQSDFCDERRVAAVVRMRGGGGALLGTAGPPQRL